MTTLLSREKDAKRSMNLTNITIDNQMKLEWWKLEIFIYLFWWHMIERFYWTNVNVQNIV